MRKRPSDLYTLRFAPAMLPPDFPIACYPYRQPDSPITHLHIHDCLELGYCVSGSGVFVVEDKILPFGAGDVSVISDRELHLARSAEGTTSEWRFISLDPARLVVGTPEEAWVLDQAAFSGPGFRNIFHGAEHPELASLVRMLADELTGRRSAYRAAVRGLAWTVMANLRRLSPAKASTAASAHEASDIGRIAPALEHMAGRYGQDIRIEDLAEDCLLSETHFRRVFSKATGESPLAYLTRLRVRMACTLLRSTDRRVLEIALDVGFPTLSSFNRHFRAMTGMSPREWRRKGPASRLGKGARSNLKRRRPRRP